MTTIKSTTKVGSENDNNISVPSNEQIRERLCKINELENGQMKEFEIKTLHVNTSVLLIRQNNQFYAYSSKCCHYKLPLIKGLNKIFFAFLYRKSQSGVLINNRLRCFAHGACFRVDTGDIEDHPGHGNLPSIF
jgi:nitrite reductase/ring-hydroxylating ferredoxin subunit